MTEEYVSFEQAVNLKELGFDWEYGKGFQMKPYYNSLKFLCQFDEDIVTTEIPAPTLAQVQKWLCEDKLIHLFVDITWKDTYDENASYYWKACDNMGWKLENSRDNNVYFDTYEEALSAGISRALEVLKKKQK